MALISTVVICLALAAEEPAGERPAVASPAAEPQATPAPALEAPATEAPGVTPPPPIQAPAPAPEAAPAPAVVAPAVDEAPAPVAPAADQAKAEKELEEIMATPASVTASPAPSPAAVVEERAPAAAAVPWAASRIELRNAVAPYGFYRAAQLTWDPKDVTSLRLWPHWKLTDTLYARALFGISVEHTQNNWTTDRAYFSDLSLMAGSSKLATIPTAEIEVAGELALTLGTGKPSQGETMLAATDASVTLARELPVLRGLSLELELGASKAWHRYTTSTPDAALQDVCVLGVDARCARWGAATQEVGGGSRNVSWEVSATLNASLTINEFLSADASFGLFRGQLYSGIDDARISNGVADPENGRYTATLLLAVSAFPKSIVSPTFGLLSFRYDQLAPDGTWRSPISRLSMLYLSLSLHPDRLLQVL